MMWEIMLSGGLGHRWPTPNSWDRGEEEEDNFIILKFMQYLIIFPFPVNESSALKRSL